MTPNSWFVILCILAIIFLVIALVLDEDLVYIGVGVAGFGILLIVIGCSLVTYEILGEYDAKMKQFSSNEGVLQADYGDRQEEISQAGEEKRQYISDFNNEYSQYNIAGAPGRLAYRLFG